MPVGERSETRPKRGRSCLSTPNNDGSGHSFRNDLFPPYKSDECVPPELRAQFDAAEDAVRAIGVAVWSMREYEADDGLASGLVDFATRSSKYE
jgi:5'-3' exonuclease